MGRDHEFFIKTLSNLNSKNSGPENFIDLKNVFEDALLKSSSYFDMN
jgi:hypothetical protein